MTVLGEDDEWLCKDFMGDEQKKWRLAIINYDDNNYGLPQCKWGKTIFFWHVYVLGPTYFIWPCKSSETHRTTRDVTPGPLSTTDTCIVYHVSHFEVSRNVILHTRYVSTCVGAGCGRGRGTKNKSYPLWSMLF
jgi:hypothetical protein